MHKVNKQYSKYEISEDTWAITSDSGDSHFVVIDRDGIDVATLVAMVAASGVVVVDRSGPDDDVAAECCGDEVVTECGDGS